MNLVQKHVRFLEKLASDLNNQLEVRVDTSGHLHDIIETLLILEQQNGALKGLIQDHVTHLTEQRIQLIKDTRSILA